MTVVGYVPTDRVQEDWKDYIKTKKDYDLAVGSGCGWVLFPTLPFSWNEARHILIEEGVIGE